MARSDASLQYDDRDELFNDYGSENSAADQIDIQHYVRILRKHKWPITLVTATVTALAAYYAYTSTPIYSATSTLLIEPQGQNYVSFDELVGFDTQGTDYYETQFELLKSRGLAYRVVSTLNLWDHPEFAGGVTNDPQGSSGAGSSSDGSAETSAGAFDSFWRKTSQSIGLSDDAGAGSDASVAGSSVTLDLESRAIISDETASYRADEGGSEQAETVNPVQAGAFSPESAPSGIPFPGGAVNVRGSELPDFAMDMNAETLARISGANELTDSEQVVLGRFMGRMSVAPVRKTKLVKLSFESADPVLAARVANAIGEQYILSHLDAKLELTTKASEWLNERLTSLKRTLDNSEQRLIAFKQENGLVDVDGSVGRLNEQELLLVTAELAQARSDLAAQRNLFAEVQAVRDQPEFLQSIPAIQADPIVQRIKIDQGQAQRQLDELRNRYGERHPRVVDASSQLQTLNSNLEGQMARVVGSITQNLQLAQQRLVSIEAKLVTGKEEIQVIGTKKFELDSLEREVNTNRNIYDTYFNRITEAKSADGLESANARVSDYAVAPLGPIKPKKQLIIALAALASLVLSALMAFLYEQLDDTIKGTADIEDKLGLKLLGIIPLIKPGLFKSARDLPLHPEQIPDKKGTFAESVNTVRTALAADDADNSRQVFLVTSSIPGEGKSTTSINLAFSMARLERVLLIDCDLRRPTVAKAAGLDKDSVGLTNLITGTAPARECIKRGLFSVSLDILPSGSMPAQPLELLSSRRFQNILLELRKHYDRIVIDCAPTQAVSDALVLGRYSDGVVYVIKSHETSIDLVKRGIQRLRQAKVQIAGTVVSQVDIDKITSYGGDYYYQGYYDYYGYTEKGEATEGRKSKRLKLSQQEIADLKNDDDDVELDLDWGGSESVQARRRSSTKQRHDSAVDSEFDMTAEIDSFPYSSSEAVARSLGNPPARKGKRTAIRDDLDIL